MNLPFYKEIQKNAKEKFIIESKEYKGNKFIDVRVFYEDEFGKVHPTKKGIAISYHKIPEIVESIIEAVEYEGLDSTVR